MTYRITTALALSIATAATAQVATRDPMRMDVAGVRLGMPIAAAKAAAVAARYRCEPFGSEATFDEQVARVVDERKGVSTWLRATSGTSELNCAGPNGESLRVWFAQVREGPIVDEFRFQIDKERVDMPALRRQLFAKYGPPQIGNAGRGWWCPPARYCDAIVFTKVPVFQLSAEAGVDIIATRGRLARDADDAAVVAAADRVLPKKTGAAL